MAGNLSVTNLSVEYALSNSVLRAVNRATFQIPPGHRIAIVGESGSGKSTLGLAMMGLLPSNARVSVDELRLDGQLLDITQPQNLRGIRGRKLAMVFQDAKASLDPVRTIRSQIIEVLKVHKIVTAEKYEDEVTRLLGEVEIPRPEVVARQYPHELSGGMRQRAMIAAALAGRPSLLIADEPTSALDVTTQATVIDLLKRLSENGGMTTLLVTHDLALVASFAQSVLVMYAGNLVEVGSVDEIYMRPSHPYTKALLAAIPNISANRMSELGTIDGSLPDLTTEIRGCIFDSRCQISNSRQICRDASPQLRSVNSNTQSACHFSDEVRSSRRVNIMSLQSRTTDPVDISGSKFHPGLDKISKIVVEAEEVCKTFKSGSLFSANRSQVDAVKDVNLIIREGESVGLVGESGSGKTTLARIIVGLETKDSGLVMIGGKNQDQSIKSSLDGGIQFVFQDPGDSLNPLLSVGQIISEPLLLRDGGKSSDFNKDVDSLLLEVGLRESMAFRRPSELSGGQRQRVAIARAISTNPKLIIADEAVASLDMSARGQILNLLAKLQRTKGFSYLYISHDLSTVRHVCDRVVVMYRGRIVEEASANEIFASPKHPYTQVLTSAVPVPNPRVERNRVKVIKVRNQSLDEIPGISCAYLSNCDLAKERCRVEAPKVVSVNGHGVACHFATESAQRFKLD